MPSNRISPLLQVIENSKGGQMLYGAIVGYMLMMVSFKGTLIILKEEERLSCIQFFGGQFSSIHYFVHLFVVHHLIL